MLKAKETKATNLNKSAIAAAAATLSHQVNTTTPTQRRATLTRKMGYSKDQAPHNGEGGGDHSSKPQEEKKQKKRSIPKIFSRKK